GTAYLAKSAADKSNAAASALADIERQRRHSELTPRLRLVAEPFNPGSDIVRLRVTVVGPPGLDRLDKLTATIRNDHFRRGEFHREHMGGPTSEQMKAHIWGRTISSRPPARTTPARMAQAAPPSTTHRFPPESSWCTSWSTPCRAGGRAWAKRIS